MFKFSGFLKKKILARGLAHANQYLITEDQNDLKKKQCWYSATVFNSQKIFFTGFQAEMKMRCFQVYSFPPLNKRGPTNGFKAGN